jgi:hypothetical protein
MAASIAVEEDSGTFSGHVHPHDGYYAGEFVSTYPTPPSSRRRDLAVLGLGTA